MATNDLEQFAHNLTPAQQAIADQVAAHALGDIRQGVILGKVQHDQEWLDVASPEMIVQAYTEGTLNDLMNVRTS